VRNRPFRLTALILILILPLGTACSRKHKPEDPRRSLERIRESLKQKPGDLNLLTEMGVSLYRLGRVDSALALWNRVLEIDSTLVDARLNLAGHLSQVGDLDSAQAVLQAVLESDSTRLEAMVNLADVFMMKGDTARALFYCRRALALDPESPSALNNLGTIYYTSGRLNEARLAYEAALKRAPAL